MLAARAARTGSDRSHAMCTRLLRRDLHQDSPARARVHSLRARTVHARQGRAAGVPLTGSVGGPDRGERSGQFVPEVHEGAPTRSAPAATCARHAARSPRQPENVHVAQHAARAGVPLTAHGSDAHARPRAHAQRAGSGEGAHRRFRALGHSGARPTAITSRSLLGPRDAHLCLAVSSRSPARNELSNRAEIVRPAARAPLRARRAARDRADRLRARYGPPRADSLPP